MLIKNLFERDIFRPINGVVKADQLDESSVWQELDEFVITRELDQHLNRFISWYLEAVDQGSKPDPSGKMGIWRFLACRASLTNGTAAKLATPPVHFVPTTPI